MSRATTGAGPRAAGVAALVAALAASPVTSRGAAANTAEKATDRYTDGGVGRDPAAFSDVLGLYGATAASGCDAAVREVTAALLAGWPPESDQVAKLLPEVTPCAPRAGVQEAVARWVELTTDVLRARPRSAAADVAAADAAYRRGDFRGASAAYRRVLAAAPWHLDARNNLALAELHAGNDAAAKLHRRCSAPRTDLRPRVVN
jgi:hypothetical protein